MATYWQTEQQRVATFGDIEVMAATLEARHGAYAHEIAEFFAILYGQQGDTGRSEGWNDVATCVRQRAAVRLAQT